MEQIASAVDNGNWENALKRSSYYKTHLKLLEGFCDFAEEEDWILALINPFLLIEQDNENAMYYTNGKHLLENKFNIENVIWWTFFGPWCFWCD